CLMLQNTLAGEGYTVRTTTVPAEAIEISMHEHFDLVIFDLRMPGKDGLEIFKAIREYLSDIMGIVITGTPDLESNMSAMRGGVFDYLVKPFEIPELLNSIAKALEHQRVTRKLTMAQEMNALQSELLLHMSHEFKTSIENIGHQSQKLLQLVQHILDLP